LIFEHFDAPIVPDRGASAKFRKEIPALPWQLLSVNCETQKEVDELWKKHSAGGKTDRCGWLKKMYVLSRSFRPH
jgi:predicted 3-demethylubiquinone-9 3-methyltransferase (glyoxalase superfamily)